MYKCPHCSHLIDPAALKKVECFELLSEKDLTTFLSIWRWEFGFHMIRAAQVLSNGVMRQFLAPIIGRMEEHSQVIEVGKILSLMIDKPYGEWKLFSFGIPKRYQLMPENTEGNISNAKVVRYLFLAEEKKKELGQ